MEFRDRCPRQGLGPAMNGAYEMECRLSPPIPPRTRGSGLLFFRPIAGSNNLRPRAELARLMVSGTFWDVAGRPERIGDHSADRVQRASIWQAIWDRDDVSIRAVSSPRAESGRGASRGDFMRRLLGRKRSRSAFTASNLFFRSRRPRRRADVPGRALPMMAEPSAAGGSHWTRLMDTHRDRSRERRPPRHNPFAIGSVSPEASTRK